MPSPSHILRGASRRRNCPTQYRREPFPNTPAHNSGRAGRLLGSIQPLFGNPPPCVCRSNFCLANRADTLLHWSSRALPSDCLKSSQIAPAKHFRLRPRLRPASQKHRPLFFAFVSFFNLPVRHIEKLGGDANFSVRQLIIRGENIINLLLSPGGKRVLLDVGIFARRAQWSDDESLHPTKPVNQRIGNPDFVNLIAVCRVDWF